MSAALTRAIIFALTDDVRVYERVAPLVAITHSDPTKVKSVLVSIIRDEVSWAHVTRAFDTLAADDAHEVSADEPTVDVIAEVSDSLHAALVRLAALRDREARR